MKNYMFGIKTTIKDTYFGEISGFPQGGRKSYNELDTDNERINYIEEILSIITKFSCNNLSKIKAIIGYRLNQKNLDIYNIESIELNSIEKKLLEHINEFANEFEKYLKEINLFEPLYSFIKDVKIKYVDFFNYLVERMTILVEYIRLSYTHFFNSYFDLENKTPFHTILHLSIYLEYLKSCVSRSQVPVSQTLSEASVPVSKEPE